MNLTEVPLTPPPQLFLRGLQLAVQFSSGIEKSSGGSRYHGDLGRYEGHGHFSWSRWSLWKRK